MVFGLRMRGCLQGQRCGVHFGGVHSARGLRAIAALPRTCILIAACRGTVCWREGKEPSTTPGGAGDGAGDGGQARISRALPVEAIGDDADAVALAVIVANEHRAGFEAAPWRDAVPATIRYRRSPSVFSDSSLSPSLLRTTAARKARTVCGCQPVERVTVAMVAPLGPHSSASTHACFEFARFSG